MSISNEQNLRCIVFALIPICADLVIAVALCRTRPHVETLSIREKLAVIRHTSQSKKSVLPHTLINSKVVYTVVLKEEKKGIRTILGLSPVSLQSDWKDSSFHLMVKCPTKSAISLAVLKGLTFRFSPTIFGAFTSAFRMFFCHFAVLRIVQILSSELKLLIGIEYPLNKKLLRYCLQLKKPYLV